MTGKAASDCGLVAGIPITAGCGDQAAGFLGAGLTEPGIMVDVAGTASVFACGWIILRGSSAPYAALPFGIRRLMVSARFFERRRFMPALVPDNILHPSPDAVIDAYRVMDEKA